MCQYFSVTMFNVNGFNFPIKTQTEKIDQEKISNDMPYTRNTFKPKGNSWARNQKGKNNIAYNRNPKRRRISYPAFR